MEYQIKQLIELSNRYFNFALKNQLKDGTHNILRGNFKGYSNLDHYPFSKQSNDDNEIRVYFNDNRSTMAINFAEIEYSEYNGKISMPINTTATELQLLYEDASEFLEYLIKETA